MSVYGVDDVEDVVEEVEDPNSQAWLKDFLLSLDVQNSDEMDLFDYEHRGLCYNIFVRYPLDLFNWLRRYLCPSYGRDCIGGCISIVTCILMLGATYYAVYWVCLFLVFLFDYLGSDYQFSLGERYLFVIDASILLYVTTVGVLALLYLLYSREISRLFTRFEDEYLPEYFEDRQFNELGVTMALVDEFIEMIGGRQNLAGLTTTEISDRFMKELTRAAGVSYSELKSREGSMISR